MDFFALFVVIVFSWSSDSAGFGGSARTDRIGTELPEIKRKRNDGNHGMTAWAMSAEKRNPGET